MIIPFIFEFPSTFSTYEFRIKMYSIEYIFENVQNKDFEDKKI